MNLSTLKDLKYAKKYLKNCIMSTNSYPALYIVLSGEVAEFVGYRKQNQAIVKKYGTGDTFGESVLFFDIKTKNEFIALSDVVAIVISRAQAAEFIREEPAFAFELMKELYGKSVEQLPEAETAGPQDAQGEPAAIIAPPAPPAAPVAEEALETEQKKAPEQKAAPAPKAPAGAASLFPEGHKTYQLSMNNQDREHLLQRKCTCPLCKTEFSHLHAREAKLVHLSTDKDKRTRYKDIEPLYYEVVTCPSCYFSALEDQFGHPDKPGQRTLPEGISQMASGFQFGTDPDSNSIFAGYYLALLCAPNCFARYQMAQAKLLFKLSRIYQDTGDAEMEMQTAQKALDAYMYVYQNMDIPPNQDQQLCILLGELNIKLGDIKSAKDYFFKAKMNKQGTPLMQRHADDRIYDIKELEGTDGKTE